MKKFTNTRFWRILRITLALFVVLFLLYCCVESSFVQLLARMESCRGAEQALPVVQAQNFAEVDPAKVVAPIAKFQKLNSLLLWVLDKIFGNLFFYLFFIFYFFLYAGSFGCFY